MLLFFAILSLPACTLYPVNLEPPAYQVIKPGQVLQLNENLTIPPDKAAVFIQSGNIVASSNIIDQWSPNCRVVVQGLEENERTIQPDDFTVIRVNYERTYALTEPVMYASRFDGVNMSSSGALPIAEEYIIYLFLKSDKQPFVKQLICKHWENPHDGNHLTVKQIRQALGTIIELK